MIRTAAILGAALALVLGAAACGGGGSSEETTTEQATTEQTTTDQTTTTVAAMEMSHPRSKVRRRSLATVTTGAGRSLSSCEAPTRTTATAPAVLFSRAAAVA